MTTCIESTDDVISMSDVVDRIEELNEGIAVVAGEKDTLTSLEMEELENLQALVKECEGSRGWEYESIIRHDYFQQYITELIDDCYDPDSVLNKTEWPYCHIELNYEAATRAAEGDYMTVSYYGVGYFIIRSA